MALSTVSVRPPYCNVGDVTARLQASTTVQTQSSPPSPTRDTLIASIILACSRRFDRLTGRPVGGFAPVYDQRYYSGRGAMNLVLDEYVAIQKVEYNLTPGTTASWSDITGDFATGRMQALPQRFWPKTRLWRINTFVVDPYRTGNIRVTGIWGNVQADPNTPAPVVSSGAPWQGITSQTAINALSPDATANTWWVIAEDVTRAIAEWSLYAFHAGRAGYGQQAGNTSGAPVQLPKNIPADVQAVINEYADTAPRVAGVTLDGSVIADESLYGSVGSPDDVSRWANWNNYSVTGNQGGAVP